VLVTPKASSEELLAHQSMLQYLGRERGEPALWNGVDSE
jgi:hypothetical protein